LEDVLLSEFKRENEVTRNKVKTWLEKLPPSQLVTTGFRKRKFSSKPQKNSIPTYIVEFISR